MRLQNKTAIVVGAGQTPGQTLGNGRATALRFAQEGARVLCIDIDEERAQDTVQQIKNEGGDAEALGVDVTDEEACQNAVEVARNKFGRIDILHNNVGRSEGDRKTTEMDADMWDTLMALNIKSMDLMLSAIKVSHISASISVVLRSPSERPTLLWSISMRPNLLRATSTAFWHASSSVTSTPRASASPPSFLIC